MTATTAPTPGLTARSWNRLLWLATGLVVAIVLVVGAFAIGRTTADTVEPAPAPAAADAPPATVAPSMGGCVPAAHTAPC
jgi:hypothetical protein